MPKKRAASSDSDSDSGPDDRAPPPKKAPEKKPKADKSSESSESGDKRFTLDKKKKVTVRDFRGVLYIDIREFFEKDGEMLPGKKGVSLNVTAWNKLKDLIPDIDEELSKH